MSVIGKLRQMFGGEEPTAEEGGESDSGPTGGPVEFHKRNVGATADHQYSYYGSYEYRGEDDRDHRVERTFDVFTAPEERRDGKPVARVTEEDEVVEDGEAELVDANEHEVVVDVDPDLHGRLEEVRTQAFCEEWHRDHATPRRTRT